ncbi:MAG: M14 family metallopeptidase [Anaerolineales bacterium]|jgi:hypothetical protein
MQEITRLFPDTYETSRRRFRGNLSIIKNFWPNAGLNSFKLPCEEDLTIDWISSDALEKNEKVVIFTTGEHGIECYVGSAMMQRFIESYLSRLNPAFTGLLFVHSINPWGMKYHRRVNEHNVDLNRNFLYKGSFNPGFNPEYSIYTDLLNPQRPVSSLTLGNISFYAQVLGHLVSKGYPALKHAILLGQYRYSRGLFYGGEGYQQETKTLMDLYRKAFSAYDQIVHLDMHTGYGPRYQMSLVNSVFETKSSAEFVNKFNYPLVVAANPQEFYAVNGDMIDFVYALQQNEFPGKKFYSTSFEFGTLGDGIYGQIGCPRAMTFENRLFWYGATSDSLADRVRIDFEELFNPAGIDWKIKAVADSDRAFDGILKAEGYI